MPSHTYFKLAEASFFLKKANDNWRNVPDFDFYLSAFFSAARSVTWIMRGEYENAPEWKAWYDAKQPDNQIVELLKKTNAIRVRSQKSAPITTRTTATLHTHGVSAEALKILSEAKDVRLMPVDSRNEEFYFVVEGRRVAVGRLENAVHELPEFPGEHALAACDRYVRFLDELVRECEKRFPRNLKQQAENPVTRPATE